MTSFQSVELPQGESIKASVTIVAVQFLSMTNDPLLRNGYVLG